MIALAIMNQDTEHKLYHFVLKHILHHQGPGFTVL